MHDDSTLLAAFATQRVAVIGDLILDEYITGQAARVSREAPVIVVEEERREWLVGGAAMPALNVACLGGTARQLGVVGPDDAGRQLVGLLRDGGVDVAGVMVDGGRRTTTKTRIVAQGFLTFPQQVARIDRLDRYPLGSGSERQLLDFLAAMMPATDAVLVSDYKNGVLTPPVVAGALHCAHAHGRLITVDTQGTLDLFAGYDLVKCNHHDAAAYLGRSLATEEAVQTAIVEIQRRLGAPAVVITRAGDGLSLYSPAEGYQHLAATNRTDVYDATGAGDTVIAVATLALAAGGSLRDACRLANLAAGIVVRKRGNQPIERAELAAALVETA